MTDVDRRNKTPTNVNQGRKQRQEDAVKIRKDKRQEATKQLRSASIMQDSEAFAATYDMVAKPIVGVTMADLPECIRIITTSTGVSDEFVLALKGVRTLVSDTRSPPLDQIIESGITPLLVQFLNEPSCPQEIKYEAAWILTNLSSGFEKPTQTEYCVECGVIGAFASLLKPESCTPLLLRDQAVWGIGNVAGDRFEYRDIFNSLDTIGMIVDHMEGVMVLKTVLTKQELTIIDNSTWALMNLIRGTPQPPLHQLEKALPTILKVLQLPSEKIFSDACCVLGYMSDSSAIGERLAHDDALLSFLVQAFDRATSCEEKLAVHHISIIQVFCNIAYGNEHAVDKLVQAGVPEMAKRFLESIVLRKGEIAVQARRLLLCALSNMVNGPQRHIQHFLEMGLLPLVVQELSSPHFDVKREAMYAVNNFVEDSTSEQFALLKNTVAATQPMVRLLEEKHKELVLLVLHAIQTMAARDRSYIHEFECVGLRRELEDLEAGNVFWQGSDVSNMASKMLTMMYSGEGEEEWDVEDCE